jgi:hypothetical protein
METAEPENEKNRILLFVRQPSSLRLIERLPLDGVSTVLSGEKRC